MSDIFDNIHTLDCLKDILLERENNNDKVSTEKLEYYVNKLYNMPNVSRTITKWMNILIDEYNRRYNNFGTIQRSIYNECLYKTIDYFLPFLSTYEKMGALIDMCSLADDEDEANMAFHQEFFEISVHNATQYENEIHFLKVVKDGCTDNGYNLLYLLGFFNFRIQNYDAAITYLGPCVAYRLEQIDNDESIRLYIKSVIYLAESYEYKSDLDNALKQLIGIDGAQLSAYLADSKIRIEISRYILNNYPNISKGESSIQYVKGLYDFLRNLPNIESSTYKIFQLKGVNDSLKSFVHVVAHCLSEYASECMAKVAKMKGKYKKEIRIYSLLQQVSRFLIDWLVVQDGSYVTCQATIRAENDACPEAIDILIKRLNQFQDIKEDGLSKTQKMEKAELQFYIFYFAEQELSINNNKKNWVDIFKRYGNDFFEFVKTSGDTNALFHYLVIRFKYLLKKSARDILQRNESADYTELDKIYYQINECYKKPLPHVFRELIQESNRLIEAYLFLREYRYLDKEEIDLCNAQEFQYRLELKKYNIADNEDDLNGEAFNDEDLDDMDDEASDAEEYDSNIIKTLIDEIEMRKRILILAPVKAAPSCSTDYIPINKLYKIVGRKNILDSFESVHSKFQQVAIEHSKKKGINKFLQCGDFEIVKWTIYYDNAVNALFLYYSEYMDGNKGEMIRANLNKNEKKHLDDLLESIEKYFLRNEKLVECSTEEHKKIYDSKDACTTWLMRGSNVCSNDKLLEMLVFAEFDLYSPTHNHKIDDEDYVMFSVNHQYGIKCKIICFNKLPNTREKGICNYCTCVNEEEVKEDLTKTLKQTENNINNCNFNGVSVDLDILKNNIDKKIKDLKIDKYDKQSQTYITIENLQNRIYECCLGRCEKNDNAKECDLLNECVENHISITE